jgi:site-specific DNA-methyltransferase (adenine-specific)
VSHARFIVADVFDGLAAMDESSVDLVLTSPPFLALRSYLPADHPDKGKEIGSEATPADFLDTLLDVAVACRRVLAPHGSLVFELGDTYSGSGGAGGDYNAGGRRDGQQKFDGPNSRFGKVVDHDSGRRIPGNGWPLPKSLCGIPHLFHLSLAYGRNLLTGREIEPWRVRNVVAWVRPNPPVGALGDKFRPATSYLTVACVSGSRYFDLDAVRQPGSENTHTRLAKRDRESTGSRRNRGKSADDARRGGNFSTPAITDSDGTAPPLDWWEIPTASYKGSHYATWPPNLLTKPILSMCPERVCVECGEPSRREQDENPNYAGRGGTGIDTHNNAEQGASLKGVRHVAYPPTRFLPGGWTDCGHDAWRNGIVLDPFAGSGTTLMVATGHGRDAIGIDLDERNAALASERCGMFLKVTEPVVQVPA